MLVDLYGLKAAARTLLVLLGNFGMGTSKFSASLTASAGTCEGDAELEGHDEITLGTRGGARFFLLMAFLQHMKTQ